MALKLRERIIESVRKRLRADVKIGSCLSGGIDSSTIVSVVNSFLNNSEVESVGPVQNVINQLLKICCLMKENTCMNY